jgi:plastocyanin
MQNKGLWMGFGVLVVAAAVALFMANGSLTGRNARETASPQPEASNMAQSPVASPTSDSTGSGSMQDIQEIVVSGDEYSFAPSAISLKAGEEVKVVFKNTGRLPHNLVIDELKASTKTIGGGQEDTITLKADKSGTYTFYCSVGNHKQLGMEGTLQVK